MSGQPFGRYLREHVFQPLGMADTTLFRSEVERSRLAMGYTLGSRGSPGHGARRGDRGSRGGVLHASVVEHQGILPGFDSQIFVAADDGVGVMGFTNGARRGVLWLPTELGRMLNSLIGVPDDVIRSDLPQSPEIWSVVAGYSFGA